MKKDNEIKMIVEEVKHEDMLDDEDQEFEELTNSVEHRNVKNPPAKKKQAVKLMKKATLKIMESKGRSSSSISSLFGVNSKFKDAVKIRRSSDEKNKIEIRHFKSFMFGNKILTKADIDKKQREMLYKFVTGYSYAIDIDEEKFFKTTQLNFKAEDVKNTQKCLEEILNVTKPVMNKMFIFTRANFSKVTNDEQEFKKDDNIMHLMELFKLSNIKRNQKIAYFKEKWQDQIREISDHAIFRKIQKDEDRYSKPSFHEISMDFIIRGKANKRLEGDPTISDIYKYEVTHQISIEYSGIVTFLEKIIFGHISKNYMGTYQKISSALQQGQINNKWKRIVQHIKRDHLEAVYADHQVLILSYII